MADLFLDDPFNDPFNAHDDNSWETAGICEDDDFGNTHIRKNDDDTSLNLESVLDGSQTEKALKSIENMDFLASQASSESLRRLALSPRKPKRNLDPVHGSPGSKPTLTFSEKLATEMGKTVPGSDKYNIFGGSSPLSTPKKPRFGTKAEQDQENSFVEEDTVVGGSDSESDADWDDKDVFVSAASTRKSGDNIYIYYFFCPHNVK